MARIEGSRVFIVTVIAAILGGLAVVPLEGWGGSQLPCPGITSSSARTFRVAVAPPSIQSPCPGGPTFFSFLGGADDDGVSSVAVDTSGNIYIAGYTQSQDFPTTPGAFDTTLGGRQDAFVAKFDSNATTLLYSTFLGGSGDESGGIALDAAGNVYFYGGTLSADFPTTGGAFDTSYNGGSGGGGDVVVAKLRLEGNGASDLVYSTFLGGSDNEWAGGLAVDSAGDVYVTGATQSSGKPKGATPFPTTSGAFDTTFNGDLTSGRDVFVSKLHLAGGGARDLVYSTFLGGGKGGSIDRAGGIAVDGSGNAYVTGTTAGAHPMTAGAFDTSFNRGQGGDAFVTKLNPAGSALVYSTYLGGKSWDEAYSIALDADGNAHVVGTTLSADFPVTPGAFDTSYNGASSGAGGDAFVTKLNAGGTALVFSTFLGGSAGDGGNGAGVAVDSSGNLYVAGTTNSVDFPTTPDAFDPTHNGGTEWPTYLDAFITRMNADGSALLYSSFLGGSDRDDGATVVLDSSEIVYVCGSTLSADFPTSPGAYDGTYNGRFDGWVAKLV